MARKGKKNKNKSQSYEDWDSEDVNPNRGMKRHKKTSKRRVDKTIIRDMMEGNIDPDLFQDWNDRQY